MYFSFGFRFGLCRLWNKEKGSWVSSDFAREAVSQKLLHQGWVEMWENRIWDFIFLGLWIFGGRSPIEEGASPSMRFNLKCVFSEIWWNGHVRFGCGGTRFEFIAPCGLEKSFGGFPSFYSRRWITFRASFLSQGWKTGLGANRGWPPRTLTDSCIPWCELSVELWLKIVCTGSCKVSVWSSATAWIKLGISWK